VVATGYVQGTGVGPQVSFQPDTEITVAANVAWSGGIAVDGNGNVYTSANNKPYQLYKETLSGGVFVQSTVPTSALGNPYGVAVDGSGSVYVADSNNFRVLKETFSAGSYSESTVATFTATDGMAPTGLAVDGSGNIYITLCCDGGTVIKQTLTATGYIQSTVVSGLPTASGVAVDGSGNVYVAVNEENGSVLMETPSSSGYTQSTIPISGAGLPFGVAVDGVGNVYITYIEGSDKGLILKETPTASGYIQSTIQTSELNQPMGIAVDGSGNVYIGNSGYYSILKEDLADLPSLNFAPTAYDATSTDSPQTLTVENVGNAPLDFLIPSTGNNPSIATNLTLNSSGASACLQLSPSSSAEGTLIAGASCTLSISFAPETVGTLSGSLVLTDNNLNAAAPGYATQSSTLSGNGLQAKPTITWATPTAIAYGTQVGATQLNASSPVAGTFAYSPAAGTVLGAGQQSLTATFTPTDTTDYTNATATVTLTVNQVTPTITWATPAAITYGTALSTTQLDATASVPGTFVYTPAAGTVPGIGNDLLSAVFTPTDTTDYSTAMSSVSLTVNPGAPILSSLSPAYASAGGAAFTLTVTGTGFTSSSVIYWGSTALTTAYSSATQLTAQVTTAEIAATGTTTIKVETPLPGEGASNTMTFEVDSASSTSSDGPTFTTLTATVSAGATASYPVTLPSTVNDISVTCLNLPTGATCSYSSSSSVVTIATSSTTPKGTYQVTVVFTETAPETAGILFPILLLPLLFMRKKLAAHRTWPALCLCVVLLAGAVLAIGCGGSSSPSSSSGPQTQQVTHSGTVTITVQ
jgi:hypothetical protein